MVAAAGLYALTPGVAVGEPLWSGVFAAAVGTVSGLAVGTNKAKARARGREAEQYRDQLREERTLRERVLDTIPSGLAVVDTDGSVRNVNERAKRILGWPEDGGEHYDPMQGDGNPVVDGGVFQQVLTTEEPAHDVKREIERGDGRRTWLSVNGAPLHDRSGELTAVIFAFEDITERKRLEAELRDTVDSLEQSNDRLRQLADAASDDLRKPLQTVSSYLQLLKYRYRDELDGDAREFVEFALEGADWVGQVVDDLLVYSRLEQRDPDLEPVDCNAVLGQVLTDQRDLIEERDADIVADDLPTVEADEHQLRQLFGNLVSNAIKYNDGSPRVEVAVEQREAHWEFSVADNGIGIDPKSTDVIFEVFERLHGKETYPGTGVGLSLCQEIVECHGGDIWVESDPGEGSTFYFTIPTTVDSRQPTSGIYPRGESGTDSHSNDEVHG